MSNLSKQKPPSRGGGKGGGKPLRGLPKDSPEVRLSKTLSWLLRHGAKSEGLFMRSDGYVRVNDLVCSQSSGLACWGFDNMTHKDSLAQTVFAHPARPCHSAALSG